jgi:hypothetical protein
MKMVDEDDLRELRREVEAIRDDVSDMSHIQSLQVRADGRVAAEAIKYFDSGTTRTKVTIYLAVDGKRSVGEIAEMVERHHSRVTRYGQEMEVLGILGSSTRQGRKIFRHTQLERAIQLSTLLKARAVD